VEAAPHDASAAHEVADRGSSHQGSLVEIDLIGVHKGGSIQSRPIATTDAPRPKANYT
jgi:hypothetical protein